MRNISRYWPLWAMVLILLVVSAAGAKSPADIPGQRIFVCGHSFNWYIPDFLDNMAKAAGITGHTTVGVQKLGGSQVIQQWNLPDAQNTAKVALRTGKVDVLTLSPNLLMPDPGIDHYAELARAHNPHVRVLVQISWLPRDGHDPSFTREQYNAPTAQQLQQLRTAELQGDYYAKLTAQVKALNKQAGTPYVFLVPAGFALGALRAEVAAGNVPGITRQSDLFTDALGHPAFPVQCLVSYCFYAAIYHRDPQDLPDLPNADATTKKLHRLLRRLAWEATCAEPLSGVKGK